MDMDIKCCDEYQDELNKKEESKKHGCETVKDLKDKYGIEEDTLVLRLLTLRGDIRKHTNIDMDFDEIFSILNSVMDSDLMNLLVLEEETKGNKLTYKQKLEKFLTLKSNKAIIKSYEEKNKKNDIVKEKTIGTK